VEFLHRNFFKSSANFRHGYDNTHYCVIYRLHYSLTVFR